ncbi:MAG: hypothetical protein ABGX16_03910 [Pirellulales bacterium]
MLKRAMLMILLVGGVALCSASEAQAWGRRRLVVRRPVVVAPVRRVTARAVLPPYPVRRVVARPYMRAYPVYPMVYGPGVSIHLGY